MNEIQKRLAAARGQGAQAPAVKRVVRLPLLSSDPAVVGAPPVVVAAEAAVAPQDIPESLALAPATSMQVGVSRVGEGRVLDTEEVAPRVASDVGEPPILELPVAPAALASPSVHEAVTRKVALLPDGAALEAPVAPALLRADEVPEVIAAPVAAPVAAPPVSEPAPGLGVRSPKETKPDNLQAVRAMLEEMLAPLRGDVDALKKQIAALTEPKEGSLLFDLGAAVDDLQARLRTVDVGRLDRVVQRLTGPDHEGVEAVGTLVDEAITRLVVSALLSDDYNAQVDRVSSEAGKTVVTSMLERFARNTDQIAEVEVADFLYGKSLDRLSERERRIVDDSVAMLVEHAGECVRS